ncbi:deoxyhypusine synthase [Methanoplanus sp. FWC-SCC4]|uniref:Deoxyhypusine synthase n=1 Tax=Methanochimaera problematica TaxID=2609417 RepID=A0AA97FCM8_9EURY|nr:deoxyhypusine synthase [Methanoplanus sp. FWC-SCC4]WOF17035.1 deoxyhypusine synthase [Methanoplanus sp. FWC-SCC4]
MNFEDICGTPVIQARVRAGMTVGELVEEYGKSRAYNAGSLWHAVNIYEKMLKDEEATKFFGLSGAMVPGGMGGVVTDLIDAGHIDVLVSTGANLTHDTIEAIGCRHYHGTEVCDDVLLREEEINRIYDVFLPNDAFVKFEEFLQDVFGQMERGSKVSIQEVTRLIGDNLDTGILATAAKKNIPVYCPAIQDSMIGLQYWMFNQTGGVTVDAFKDVSGLMDICFNAKRSGAMLIGGGVPKNYIFQSMLMTPKGFDYAVQLTGDRPDLGGLSGATLEEAKSWGKITEEASSQTVYGDASINFPLLVAATLERIERG